MSFVTDEQRIYATFLLFGFAYLLPYSSVLAAVDYYKAVFGGGFMMQLTPFLSIPCLALLFMRVFLGCCPNDRLNVIIGFSVLLLASVLAPIAVNPSFEIFVGVTISIGGALAQGSLLAFAACAGPGSSSAIQTGMGTSAVVAIFFRALAKLLAPTLYASLFIQFGITFVFVALSLAVYQTWFVKLEFMQDLLRIEEKTQPEMGEPLISNELAEPGSGLKDNLWTLVTLRALLFSATWNFFVSLAVFPGVVTQLPVNGLSDRQLQWFLLGMFSAFTSGDLIGKFLPSFSQLRLGSPNLVAFLVFLRTAFIPILLFWRSHPANPVVLLLTVFFIGGTNGYFGSVSFELIAVVLPDEKHRAYAGTAVTFFVLAGISLGSTFASVAFRQ